MRYSISLGNRILEVNDLQELVDLLEREYSIDVEVDKNYDRIIFEVNLPMNILNYVLVVSRLNYAHGYPIEFTNGVSLEDAYKLYRSGIRRAPWFIAQSILTTMPKTIDELYELLYEVNDFIKYKNTTRLKPIYTWDEIEELERYFPGTRSLFISLLKNIDRESIDLLVNVIKKCYNNFYEKYWRTYAEKRLENIAGTAKKILYITKPLEVLEKLVNKKPSERITGVPVDVFRDGGGIYNGKPDKVVLTSGIKSLPSLHLAIVHEYGHLLVHGWEKKVVDEIFDFAHKIGIEPSIKIPFTLEEIFMALLQRLADEEIIKRKRITHGLMNTFVFNEAYNLYKKIVVEEEFAIDKFMTELMNVISRDKLLIREFISILNMLFKS